MKHVDGSKYSNNFKKWTKKMFKVFESDNKTDM